MAQKLAKHGSEAGYNAHHSTNDMCERCRNAHRVYARQYRPKGKAAGLKYSVYDVVDHLYTQSQAAPGQRQSRAAPSTPHTRAAENAAEVGGDQHTEPRAAHAEESPQPASGPSLADRLSDGMRRLVMPGSNDYVNENDIPDYLHESEPDPEPAEEWEGPEGDEYVINKASLILIEENLGTYLSVVGITLEMIDPYCGPILADNFENIVGRWTKVIAKYPRAAKLFMSKEGGTIMSWIGGLQATWPVLLALYDHHLAKNVKVDNLGRAYRVTNPEQNQNGQTRQDATTPPFQFTVD